MGENMTKHERLLNHIKQLKIGTKISVRQLAKELDVSEGTAYRAIKDAQLAGLVHTIPRIGTLRIGQKNDNPAEKLTFAEIVEIVDGKVLGGKEGLYKPLSKFLIGTQDINTLKRLIKPNNLVIVGDRKEAQMMALQNEAAVLAIGDYPVDNEVINIADKYQMPLILSAYDSYTVATSITKALYRKLDVVRVKDVMAKEPYYLDVSSTVAGWKRLMEITHLSKFPVVDKDKKVVGIATTNDVAGFKDDTPIKNIMSKNPIVVSKNTPVAHVARLLVWEGIELVPVVENKILIGVITRLDAIRALKNLNNKPQIRENIDSTINSLFSLTNTEKGVKLRGKISPIMLNPYGIASSGALMTAMVNAGYEAFGSLKRVEIVLDSFSIYFSTPVQFEEEIEIEAKVIDMSKKSGKAEVNLMHGETLVAKSLLSVRVVDK